MPVITNNYPYYDDYDPLDGYHRILFKPGVAVQARELTQLQTILQNQINKLGDRVVDDGVVLTGAVVNEKPLARSVRLQSTFNGSAINVNDFLGKYVGGRSSNVVGKVEAVFAADDPETGDPPTIIIDWKQTGNNGRAKSGIFQSAEVIYFYDTINAAVNAHITSSALGANTTSNVIISTTGSIEAYSKTVTLNSAVTTIKPGDYVFNNSLLINDYDTELYVSKVISSIELELNKPAPAAVSSDTILFIRESTQKALYLTATPGVFYKNGFFVQSGNLTLTADKYNAFPYKGVGLDVNFEVIDYIDDPNLLDPAVGSTNYYAPGADRLKANVSLVSVDLTANLLPDRQLYDNFIPIKNYTGEFVFDVNRVSYDSGLSKELSERTYLESGNYTVSRIGYSSNFVSNNTSVNFTTKGGVYFIGGNLVKVNPQTFTIQKGRSTKRVTQTDIGTKYAFYSMVYAPKGGLVDPADIGSYANLEIHTTVTPSSTSTKIGHAIFKNLEYDSGTGLSKLYRLYLHNLNNMTDSFANARCFINKTGGSYSSPAFQANIITAGPGPLLSNNATLFGSKTSSLFPLPNPRISSVLANTFSYAYRTTFENTSFTSGVGTITLSNTNETWYGGTGTISSTTLITNYTAVSKSTNSAYINGQFIDLAASGTTVSVDGTGKVLTVTLPGANFTGSADVLATIEVDGQLSDVTFRSKTKVGNTFANVNIQAVNTYYSLLKSDVYKINKAWVLPQNNAYVGAWSSSQNYYIGNVVSFANAVYRVNVSHSSAAVYPNASSNFTSITADTISKYVLDNGQRDSYYDHGRVLYNNTNPAGNVVVLFDYFSHSGTGPIVKNSYDSAGLSYENIPIYITEGGSFAPLTDYIDFRPRRTDDVSTYTFAQAIMPTAIGTVETDLYYYLPRTDIFTLDKYGKIKVIQGSAEASAPVPVTKLNDKEEILLGTVFVQPYTMSKNEILINLVNRKRYTMVDIGRLESRINTLSNLVGRLLYGNNIADVITDDDGTAYDVKSYFVEDFSNGYKYADISHPDYSVTYEQLFKAIGPLLSPDTIMFNLDSATVDHHGTSNVVTMLSTEEAFINNLDATADGPVTINPFELASLQGRLIITPQSSPLVNQVLTASKSAESVLAGSNKSSSLTYGSLGAATENLSTGVTSVLNSASGTETDAIAFKNNLDAATKSDFNATTFLGNDNKPTVRIVYTRGEELYVNLREV
jgi:hypothetical protein